MMKSFLLIVGCVANVTNVSYCKQHITWLMLRFLHFFNAVSVELEPYSYTATTSNPINSIPSIKIEFMHAHLPYQNNSFFIDIDNWCMFQALIALSASPDQLRKKYLWIAFTVAALSSSIHNKLSFTACRHSTIVCVGKFKSSNQ